MKWRDRVIVAMDTSDFPTLKRWVRSLKGWIRYFKVGLELFTSVGADAVHCIRDEGGEVFLDLKFHDIPSTVARAARVAKDLGVRMFNVHAMGGLAMMRAAKDAVTNRRGRPSVLGVTILTSLEQRQLSQELGIARPMERQVLHLATLCRKAGLDGVVASAREVRLIKRRLGTDFVVVTPGIRPQWSVKGDQARVVTPREAFEWGADFIVVGRPITESRDLGGAARKLIEEVGEL